MTVLNVAYPFALVGPDEVGGAEQVLSALDGALVAAGHRSVVVAEAGSSTFGELVSLAKSSSRNCLDKEAMSQQRSCVRACLRRSLSEQRIDVVHMHGVDFHHYLPAPGPPVLVTLHLPLSWYPEQSLRLTRPNTWFNCVSETSQAGAGPNRCITSVIKNGVPVDKFGATRVTRRDYIISLARVCPEKGQHLALEAAHLSGSTLLLGGDVFAYEAHQQYYQAKVRPLLDAKRRFLGPLGFARKRRLIAGAACLIIPSIAPETSSLVAMEAASCGTPVIAFRVGALPEVVEHGRTGFIVDDVVEMAIAIKRSREIDPETCRAVARERFRVQTMTDAYMNRYSDLAASNTAHLA